MENLELIIDLMSELTNESVIKDNESIKLEKIYSDIGELQQKTKKEDSNRYDDLIADIADVKRDMIKKYIQIGMALERVKR